MTSKNVKKSREQKLELYQFGIALTLFSEKVEFGLLIKKSCINSDLKSTAQMNQIHTIMKFPSSRRSGE